MSEVQPSDPTNTHHRNDERVESHIYLTLLAYQLFNTIRYMLKEKIIHHDWQNIVRIMNTQTIQSMILPYQTKTIYLEKLSRPIKEALEVYQATNAKSIMPANKKYVLHHKIFNLLKISILSS